MSRHLFPHQGRDRQFGGPLGWFLCWGLVLLAGVGFGEISAAELSPPPRRYLLVVDTSFSMGRCGPAARAAVAEAATTGLQGRMRDGDAFDLWTFDAFTRTRSYPPQVWMRDLSQAAGRRVSEFMARTRFEGQGRPEVLIKDLLAGIKTQTNLSVVIITDGESAFQGTPFDSAINAALKSRYRDLHQARKPFQVVLEAEEGQLRYWSVSAAGEALKFARPLEPERVLAKLAPQELLSSSATNKVVSTSAVAEAKPETPPTQTDKPQAAAVSPPTTLPAPTAPPVSSLTQPKTTTPAVPLQAAPSGLPAVQPVKETPSKAKVAGTAESPVASPAKQPAEAAPPVLAQRQAQTQAAPKPPPATTASPTQPSVAQIPAPPVRATSPTPPPPAEPAKKLESPPQVPVSMATPSVTSNQAPAVNAQEAVQKPKPAVQPNEAMLLPQPGDRGRKTNLFIAGGLLLLAVGLVTWLWIQRRSPRGASLITKSMDRSGPH